MMLLHDKTKITDVDLDLYHSLGVYGLGLDKDLIVGKDDNGHINYTDTEMIQRVSKLITKFPTPIQEVVRSSLVG